jgi:hypothetical protein
MRVVDADRRLQNTRVGAGPLSYDNRQAAVRKGIAKSVHCSALRVNRLLDSAATDQISDIKCDFFLGLAGNEDGIPRALLNSERHTGLAV